MAYAPTKWNLGELYPSFDSPDLQLAFDNVEEQVLSFEGIRQPILRLSAHGYDQALPINVGVTINGATITSFAAPDGRQELSIPLRGTDPLATGEIVTLHFDHTGKPSDANPKSQDHRDLALRVDRLWVEEAAPDEGRMDASVRSLRGGPGAVEGVAVTR